MRRYSDFIQISRTLRGVRRDPNLFFTTESNRIQFKKLKKKKIFVKTGPDGCLSRYFNLFQSVCFFSQLLLLLTRTVGKSVVRFPEWVHPPSLTYPNKKKRFSNDAFWFWQDCVISKNSIKYNSIVVPSGKFGENWDILGVWMLIAGNYWKWHNPQEFHNASVEIQGFFIWAPLESLVGGTHSDKRATNFRRSG